MKNCVLKGFGVLKLNKEIVLLRRREVYKGENGNIDMGLKEFGLENFECKILENEFVGILFERNDEEILLNS